MAQNKITLSGDIKREFNNSPLQIVEIKIVIFEDQKLVRDAFEAIINGTPGFQCVGSFGNAEDIIFRIQRSNPDVVLMDIEMPGINGIEATRIMHHQFPEIKVLIQTVFDDEDKIFRAICSGASGYILKDSTPSRLLEAIQEVYNGGAPMTPVIANKVLNLFQKFAPDDSSSEQFNLSKREKEVLSCMVKGSTFKQIAENYFITYETVRTHVKKIYKKLHVTSLTDAVVKAIRHRLF